MGRCKRYHPLSLTEISTNDGRPRKWCNQQLASSHTWEKADLAVRCLDGRAESLYVVAVAFDAVVLGRFSCHPNETRKRMMLNSCNCSIGGVRAVLRLKRFQRIASTARWEKIYMKLPVMDADDTQLGQFEVIRDSNTSVVGSFQIRRKHVHVNKKKLSQLSEYNYL